MLLRFCADGNSRNAPHISVSRPGSFPKPSCDALDLLRHESSLDSVYDRIRALPDRARHNRHKHAGSNTHKPSGPSLAVIYFCSRRAAVYKTHGLGSIALASSHDDNHDTKMPYHHALFVWMKTQIRAYRFYILCIVSYSLAIGPRVIREWKQRLPCDPFKLPRIPRF